MPKADRSRRGFLFLALALLPIAGRTSPADAPIPRSVVVVVRHAEKADTPADDLKRPLLPAGRKRAEDLADVVQGLNEIMGKPGVAVVFATEYERTLETVTPLANRFNATPLRVPAKQLDGPNGLIAQLKARMQTSPGKILVVAGHSDTVPDIVKKLSGVSVDPILQKQYDNLYVVSTSSSLTGTVTRLRYGQRSP